MQAVERNPKILMECYNEIRKNVNNLNTQLKREYFSTKSHSFKVPSRKLGKLSTKLYTNKSNITVVPNLTEDGQILLKMAKSY